MLFFLPPLSDTTMIKTALLFHGSAHAAPGICSIVSSQLQAREIIESAGTVSPIDEETLQRCLETEFAEDGTERVDLTHELTMLVVDSLSEAFIDLVDRTCEAGRPASIYAQGPMLPRVAGQPGLIIRHDGKTPVIEIVYDKFSAKAALDRSHQMWSSHLRRQGREQLAACALPERADRATQTIQGFAAHAIALALRQALGLGTALG